VASVSAKALAVLTTLRGVFRFSPDTSYLMPAHFGGAPLSSWTYGRVTSVGVSYRTDHAALSKYVPECFEIPDPVLEVGYAMNRGVEWMAGGGYNLVAVNVPVEYRHASERITGSYALVVWESKATPILGGREQTGIPKIFADVADLHEIGDRVFGNVSFEGSTFMRVDARKTEALTATELADFNRRSGHLNWFGWRYIPNTGQPGAALNHPTLYPIDYDYTAAWRADATVTWHLQTWEQNPTQAHIIEALGRLPIEEYVGCLVNVGSQVIRVDTARELAW
jgi:acetoacetate decarboxylase